jgi:hypothetical protein
MMRYLILVPVAVGVAFGLVVRDQADVSTKTRAKSSINPAYIKAVASRSKLGVKSDVTGRYRYNYVGNKRVDTSGADRVTLGTTRVHGNTRNARIQNYTVVRNVDLNVKKDNGPLSVLRKKKEVNVGGSDLSGKEISGKRITTFNYIENVKSK